jgi:hypothetical protein
MEKTLKLPYKGMRYEIVDCTQKPEIHTVLEWP